MSFNSILLKKTVSGVETENQGELNYPDLWGKRPIWWLFLESLCSIAQCCPGVADITPLTVVLL